MKRILLIGLVLLFTQVYAGDLYTVSLDNLDVHIIKTPNIKLEPDLLLSEIEVLA